MGAQETAFWKGRGGIRTHEVLRQRICNPLHLSTLAPGRVRPPLDFRAADGPNCSPVVRGGRICRWDAMDGGGMPRSEDALWLMQCAVGLGLLSRFSARW